MKDIVIAGVAIIGIILLVLFNIVVSFLVFSGLLYLGSLTGFYEWSWALSLGIYALVFVVTWIIKVCLSAL